MRITYYGHSCFTLESQGFRVVVDPYRNYVPGYRALHLEADAVFCSHGHDDHAWVQAVTIRENAPADPFTVTEVAGFHGQCNPRLRFLLRCRVQRRNEGLES